MTVDRFIAALAKPAAGQSGFTVKKMFTTSNGGGEHIWLVDLKFDGVNFTGKVDNDPEHVPSVKLGDSATVSRGEISDWMYMEKGLIVGAYTLRVLKKNAVGQDAEEMKQFKFKD